MWSQPSFLDRETLIVLSRRSTTRWLLAVGREWLTIGLLIWWCIESHNPIVWVACTFVIGSRQHALAVLVHDAAHYLVHRSRFVNDTLANALAAYPLFFPVQGYRTNHLEHHRLLETPRDPEQLTINAYPEEFTFPMPRRRLYWLMLRDLIGGSIRPMSTLIDYVWAVPGCPVPHITGVIIVHATALTAALVSGHPMVYVVLWVAPAFSSFTLFFRLRTAAEHSGIGSPEERYKRHTVDPLATTRTFVSGFVTRYLMSPYNISYHTEHHLYPTVPGFRLRKLRATLEECHGFAEHAHLTRGLRGLLTELTTVTG